MTYKVRLSPHAVRDYKKLDVSIKSHIKAALDALEHNPFRGSQIKRLKGRLHEYYRYRVSDYRIVYAVVKKECVVYVDHIQHRRDVYRSV